MNRQIIVRGALLLIVGVVATGCSQNTAWLNSAAFDADASFGTSLAAANRAIIPKLKSSAGKSDSDLNGVLAMARLSERRGQTARAENLYERIIEKYPKNPVPHHRLGVMQAKEGQFAEAKRHFARAMQLNPDDPELLCDIGYLYYLEDSPEKAEQCYQKSLKLKPNNPRCHSNFAVLAGEKGEYKQSLASFRRAGGEPEAQANLAFIQSQRGDVRESVTNYSRALTLDSKMRPAAQAMVQLAERMPPKRLVFPAKRSVPQAKRAIPQAKQPVLQAKRSVPQAKQLVTHTKKAPVAVQVQHIEPVVASETKTKAVEKSEPLPKEMREAFDNMFSVRQESPASAPKPVSSQASRSTQAIEAPKQPTPKADEKSEPVSATQSIRLLPKSRFSTVIF